MSEERVGIEVSLDGNLAAEATVAAERLDDLGDQAKQAQRKLAALRREASRTGKQLEILAFQANFASTSLDTFNRRVSRLHGALRGANREMRETTSTTNRVEQATRRADRTFGSFWKTMRKVRSVVRTVMQGMLKLSVSFAIVAAGAWILQVSGQILGVVYALGSLVAFAALLPAALGSAIAIFGVMAMALHGVAGAIQAAASKDWQKFANDMQLLSPAARDFVWNIYEMLPALAQFQDRIQDNVFGPINKALVGLINTLWPSIFSGMDRLSTAIGDMFAELFRGLSTSAAGEAFDSLFQSAIELVNALKTAIFPLGQGLADVIKAAGPSWVRFTAALSSGLTRFGLWLSQISADGRLDRWLDMAFHAASDLVSSLASLARILGAIGKAGGKNALKSMADALGRFADFLNTPIAQNGMKAFFDALPGITSIATPLAIALLVIAGMSNPISQIILLVVAISLVLASFQDEIHGVADEWKSIFTDDNSAVLERMESAWSNLTSSVTALIHRFLGMVKEMFKDKSTREGLKDFFNIVSTYVIPALKILIEVIVIGLFGAFMALIWVISKLSKLFVYLRRKSVEQMIGILHIVVSVIDKILTGLILMFIAMPGGAKYAAQLAEGKKQFDDWAKHVETGLNELGRDAWIGIPTYDIPERLNPRSPEGDHGRFAGGPVWPGAKFTVGELGKEMFIPDSGRPQMVGVGGQEDRTFATSGMIVPNHLLAHAEAMAAKLRDTDMTARVPRQQADPVQAGATYNFSIQAGPQASAEDIAGKVTARIRRAERERAERR